MSEQDEVDVDGIIGSSLESAEQALEEWNKTYRAHQLKAVVSLVVPRLVVLAGWLQGKVTEVTQRLIEAERAAGVLQEEREQAEERAERAERDRDRYERALCALWAHPEFNRNLFRWVADTLGIEREGTK